MKKLILFSFIIFFYGILSCSGMSRDDMFEGEFIDSPEIENILVKSNTSIEVHFSESMASEGLLQV